MLLKSGSFWVKVSSSQARFVVLLLIDILLILGLIKFIFWVAVLHRIVLFIVTIQYVRQLDTHNKMQRVLEDVDDAIKS